ncbi:MAG: PEGA domain-containing protein, partial [Blastocatellia bacterium]
MKRSIRHGAIFVVLSLSCLCPARTSGQSQAGQEQRTPAGPAGSLRVKTDVPDVQVILDDKEAGRTPLTLRSVPAGLRHLTLVKEGYEDHTQQVEVADQKTASVFVVMKPVTTPLPELPVEFKVMHQHKFGYCVGILTVSAKALDYKADRDEDKFQIPIQTLKS